MENEQERRHDRLSMMTLHGAKGLEFDTVFLPGWEEGLFPSQRSMDENGNKGLEEERRLAYVGITRARRRAIISHAANRLLYANWQQSIPSRFIDEIAGGARGARRVGRDGAGAAADGAHRVHRAVPADGAPPADDRGVGAAGAAQARRPAGGGPRVFHQKFGYGTVNAVSDDRLDVRSTRRATSACWTGSSNGRDVYAPSPAGRRGPG